MTSEGRHDKEKNIRRYVKGDKKDVFQTETESENRVVVVVVEAVVGNRSGVVEKGSKTLVTLRSTMLVILLKMLCSCS